MRKKTIDSIVWWIPFRKFRDTIREKLIKKHGMDEVVIDYSKKSYSQDGEDLVLASFYEGSQDYKGFYVDIGALSPLRFSNTQIFYEMGWRGINIDATPGSMKEFEKIRHNDTNIEVGIADKTGVMKYYSFEEPALNSFDKEISIERIERGWKLKCEIDVKIDTINNILSQYLPINQKIDFINMDVEGLELKILENFDFEKYAPKFFIIEELDFVNTDFMNYKSSKIYQLLLDRGYLVLAKTRRSVIFGGGG